MTASTGKQPLKRASKSTIRGEDIAQQLADIPDFEKGRQQQRRIIQLGDKFRELRESVLQINQTEAARLAGMEQSELSRIEAGTGARGPSSSTIVRIIDAYETYLRTHRPDYHVGLSIQTRRVDTDEVQRSFLAGSE